MDVKFKSRLSIAFMLALWSSMACAIDCSSGGYVGTEAGRNWSRSAALNPGEAFSRSQDQTALYGELSADCSISSALKLHGNFTAEHLHTHGESGVAQESDGEENRGFVREAYLSLSPDEALFIDIGKKDIRNGHFFFISPLDVLLNPLNYSTQGITHALGASWQDAYREGSMAIQASWFTAYGTLELAVLPKLANESSSARVADWTTLQRINGEERYYAAYTTSIFEDFNPRVVLVGGERFAGGIGTSGYLTDDWILNLELAAAEKSHIKTPSGAALSALRAGQFPSADALLREQESDLFYQFAAGLRYATENNTAISLEYLYQDQGYTDRQWDIYFDTLEFTERAYQASGFPLYRGYQLLFAQEADNNARRDLMLGRHYLMSHIERSSAELRTLSWEVAAIYNLEDENHALNLHLSSQLSRQFEVYAGGNYLGGAGRSEFGRLGTNGGIYAGVRAIW